VSEDLIAAALREADEVLEPKQLNGKSRRKRKRKGAPVRDRATELQLSEKLVREFGKNLRYCGPLGGWFAWNGACWERDMRGRAPEAVKQMARSIGAEAAALLDPNRFKDATRAGSAAGVRAILELARSAPEIAFSPDEADADPWLLNVENGTIDLRTGTLRPHDRRDLITKCCPVPYDPEATAPRFEKFLAEIQPRQDVRNYLGRSVGYAAIGIVRENVVIVCWGCGANGKSVFVDVVTHVLGDYAKPGPSSLIVDDGKQHPTDVASCFGSRLVVVHETKRGAAFDASKIKLLTGGDRLTARYMRQDFFDFAPTHTLIMLSNYRPQADSTDAALWRRVQLVPFDVVIPEEKQDRELAEKIKAEESSGLLRWIVEGALEWQKQGLDPPDIIREQTAAYRAAEDVIGQFVEDRCVRLRGVSVRAANLYAAFKQWCSDTGASVVRMNDFSAELQARGFERRKDRQGAAYHGIGLHAEEDDR